MIPRRDTRYHVLLGVAGGLGLLALIACGLLFVREGHHAGATAPEPAAPAPLPETRTPVNPSGEVQPQLPPPDRPPARRVRPPKAELTPTPFRGTVWPAQAHVTDGTVHPAPAEPAPAAEPVEPADEAPAAEEPAVKDETPAADAPAAEARPGSGKLKRVFGSIFKPFRGRKATQDPPPVPAQKLTKY